MLRDPHAALLAAIDPPDLSHLDAAATELFDRGILTQDRPWSSSSTSPPVLSTAKMTAFGAICHVLPLHFDLTRLVVFGARSGRFIAHAVVMAVYIAYDSIIPALSHQPTDLYDFYRSLEVTQLGRQNADAYHYSDVITGLRIFRMVCTKQLEKYCFKQLHFTRVRTFCQSVSEICQHLMQHLPHHVGYLKALHRLASFRDTATLQTCDTILPLAPMDIKYCKFMLAQVFIPIHEIMRGSPAKAAPSHSITIYVPEDHCCTFKTDLSNVFDAILPFIDKIRAKGEPVTLPKPLPRAAASSSAALYRPIRMKFTHLDGPPSPFSFIPLPLRIFDIASTHGPRGFLRFPFYSLDGGRSGLVEPGLLWLEEKKGGPLTTSWSLGRRKCELEQTSILAYLTATTTETPIFAVCAAMLAVVNRKKGVYHCQKITVLNNDLLLFALIMLALTSDHPRKEAISAVDFRGQTFPLDGTVSPLFFAEQNWQRYESQLGYDWLVSEDGYPPIDTLNPQFLEKLLDILSSHFIPSLAHQVEVPCLSDEQEKALFLAVYRICSISNNQSASLKKVVRNLGSHFGTTHPLCQDTTALCSAIQQMNIPTLNVDSQNVFIAQRLPTHYQWQVSKTELEPSLLESTFCREPQPEPVTSFSQQPTSSCSDSSSVTSRTNVRTYCKELKNNIPDLVLQMDSMQLRQKDIQRFMEALAANIHVTQLSLRECDIRDTESIGNMLIKNGMLNHMDLSGNNLAKATIFYQALSVNTSLKVLILQSANLGVEAIKALGCALGKNCTLRSLDISSNQLGASGAKQMVRSFQANTGLTSLTLNDNAFGDAGAKHIVRLIATLPALTSLAMESNQIQKSGSRELLKGVVAHSSLRNLAISKNPEIPGNLISLIETKLSLRCEAVLLPSTSNSEQ